MYLSRFWDYVLYPNFANTTLRPWVPLHIYVCTMVRIPYEGRLTCANEHYTRLLQFGCLEL